MKKLSFTLSFMFLLTLTFSVFAQNDQKPYLTKTFRLNSNGNLVTTTSGGSIKVTGTSGNDVKVVMYVRPNNWKNRDDAPSAEALEKYRFEVRQEGNTVYAIAERKDQKWDNKTALNVSFEIEVPEKIATKLSTSGGSISLAHVSGHQQANTSGGSLNFQDLQGEVDGSTSGGSITVSRFSGNLDATTSGGSIKLNEATGALKVSTSGGSISLNKVSGDISAHTSGGSINADVEKLGKFLTLGTSGGSVRATIPANQGLDLDLAGNRVKTTVTNFTGTAKDDRVKGSMNGGGIPVKMSTSGGTTELSYRM
ncbi:MAG: hypothetical protein COW65_00465 [Cytophagales bacterium CG18_big_fil_WC_8_21_14_2_50_42_9]|nr:MAG: hypothetical protein COW65_00465 [Cytophagales bacterium CG18_big_fil_WC_8_21_14_2_50_42_9]